MEKGSGLAENLTPREWEVLALVRAGLTNDQIAERLGISRDGVKYHVSEILGKLGVEDRIEAARWYDRESRRRAGALGAVAGLFRRRPAPETMRLPALAAIAAVAVAVLALLAGVLLMESRHGDEETVEPPPPVVTGEEPIDQIIGVLTKADESRLRQNFSSVNGIFYDFNVQNSSEIDADWWVPRLAGASTRELFAVFDIPPERRGIPPGSTVEIDHNVWLKVTLPDGTVEGWQFGLAEGLLESVHVGDSLETVGSSVEQDYDSFLVLPLSDYLPQPPSGHALSVRSGDGAVDAVLDLIESGDTAGLQTLLQYEQQPCGAAYGPECGAAAAGSPVEAMAVHRCSYDLTYEAPSYAQNELASLVQEASAVHAVINLPEGYVPAGDQLIIVVRQEAPYRWSTAGLVLREDAIVGLATSCGSYPAQMYPPAGFLVQPPAGLSTLAPGGRSGLPQIDGFLDAMAADDAGMVLSLIHFRQIGCAVEPLGIGSPPECRDDEAPGQLIDVLPVAQCEGGYVRSDEMQQTLEALLTLDGALYAVVDRGGVVGTSFDQGRHEAVIYAPDEQRFNAGHSLVFDDEGLTTIWYGCGQSHPYGLIRSGLSPGFLLPPP